MPNEYSITCFAVLSKIVIHPFVNRRILLRLVIQVKRGTHRIHKKIQCRPYKIRISEGFADSDLGKRLLFSNFFVKQNSQFYGYVV